MKFLILFLVVALAFMDLLYSSRCIFCKQGGQLCIFLLSVAHFPIVYVFMYCICFGVPHTSGTTILFISRVFWGIFYWLWVVHHGTKFPDPAGPKHVVQSITNFWKSMGLEMSGQNVEELVGEHNEELITEKLQDLHQ